MSTHQLAEVRQAPGLVAFDGRMAAQQVLQHAVVVQEVMQAVMKPEIHFGKIPGTDKPTLFQPGADKLLMAFRIAPEFGIEDLSTADCVRYRVTCRGVHQVSGVALGSCVGEASSNEEKYKWRRAVNDKEFDATPITHRRVKYGKNYDVKQIRTEPADVANTVLKMAEKRAKIGMVLNVTGASDMFGQDLEDLDAALRDSLLDPDRGQSPQVLRDDCARQVAEAHTEAELQAAVKRCVPLFQKTKDTEGYSRFRALVQERGAEIKAAAQKAPASETAAADAPAQNPAASMDADSKAWADDMSAAEQGAANA